MWSLIKRKDDDVYDIVPSSWLKSKEICFYPNANFKTTNIMAKNCAKPEEDWEEIEIFLVKKDYYDDFDRGYGDMIRRTTGKRTLSESEKEDKGKGKRKKTQKRLLYEANDQCSGVSQFVPFGSETSEDSLSSEDSGVLADRQEGEPLHFSVTKKPKKKKLVPPLPTLEMTPKQLLTTNHQNSPSCSATSSKNVSRVEMCPQSGKTHCCSFDEAGNVTMQTIGKTLCTISRTLALHSSKFHYLKDETHELKQMLLGIKNCSMLAVDMPTMEETSHVDNILGFFPINSMDKLREVELKLAKEKDFYTACVTYFASAAEKGTENRTVTSILCRILTLELAQIFTFKGVQRKDHKERKESFQELNLSKVLFAALQKCWPKADIKKATSIAARRKLIASMLKQDQN